MNDDRIYELLNNLKNTPVSSDLEELLNLLVTGMELRSQRYMEAEELLKLIGDVFKSTKPVVSSYFKTALKKYDF